MEKETICILTNKKASANILRNLNKFNNFVTFCNIRYYNDRYQKQDIC